MSDNMFGKVDDQTPTRINAKLILHALSHTNTLVFIKVRVCSIPPLESKHDLVHICVPKVYRHPAGSSMQVYACVGVFGGQSVW